MRVISEAPVWYVTYYSTNLDQIKQLNIIKHKERLIRELKKVCSDKAEFEKQMRLEFMSSFWSKCEWELIIEVDPDNRIWLTPWVGCREPQTVRIDVTDFKDFDWRGFAELHISRQIHKDRAKIDVFDQLNWRWQEFIDYCWGTRFKYERHNLKFNL